MRFHIFHGSHSAHCCFKASVVDGSKPGAAAVCECYSVEEAERIAAALNLFDRARLDVNGVCTIRVGERVAVDGVQGVLVSWPSSEYAWVKFDDGEMRRVGWRWLERAASATPPPPICNGGEHKLRCVYCGQS